MTRLQTLYAEFGQSPWLDNLSRAEIEDGTLQRWIDQGVRGVTANPSIFAKAMTDSPVYDNPLNHILRNGADVEEAYWEMARDDVRAALGLFRPLYDSTRGGDGFVSIEVAPDIAHDTNATIEAARQLHESIDLPNLMVKIPATSEGIPAIEEMTSEGRSINVTLIFTIPRYEQVMEAYASGIERLINAGGDPNSVHSVASFFVSRVDTEVDRRLGDIDGRVATALGGEAAIAQAKVAYQMFQAWAETPRWRRLAASGAHLQRPLWASTSTKDPAYPDTMYVDELIGLHTVTTLTEATIAAFEDHGALQRSIDSGSSRAHDVIQALDRLGVDLNDVGAVLETQGVERFLADQRWVIEALKAKAQDRAMSTTGNRLDQ